VPTGCGTPARSGAPIPPERLNKEVKRRTDVVGIFPDDAFLLRLASCVLIEAHDEWQAPTPTAWSVAHSLHTGRGSGRVDGAGQSACLEARTWCEHHRTERLPIAVEHPSVARAAADTVIVPSGQAGGAW
jgi:Transposase, Mutator family